MFIKILWGFVIACAIGVAISSTAILWYAMTA